MFSKNRNRLKRTSFLLINLAVADLFVGFTEIISLGAFNIPGQTSTVLTTQIFKPPLKYLFLIPFVYFLALIYLEIKCICFDLIQPSGNKYKRLH